MANKHSLPVKNFTTAIEKQRKEAAGRKVQRLHEHRDGHAKSGKAWLPFALHYACNTVQTYTTFTALDVDQQTFPSRTVAMSSTARLEAGIGP